MRISAKFELVSVYKDLHSDQYDTGYLQIQVVRGSETIVITASTTWSDGISGYAI